MLDGLPDFYDHVVGALTRQRRPGSLPIMIYHLLGDVSNAAEYSLTHYFPLTLTEPFLQNSSIGTPYQKWALFTNKDFQNVDQCLRRLLQATAEWWQETTAPECAVRKDAWHWFEVVNTQYVCCAVNPDKPELTISAINVREWVDPVARQFLNVWNRPPWEERVVPPVVTKSAEVIANRAAVTSLQQTGLRRLKDLRIAESRLAGWLRANCTIDEVTATHKGTLKEFFAG
jgi:hypothetical protein